jgi:N-acyl-L-homoserine lactone synthetase
MEHYFEEELLMKSLTTIEEQNAAYSLRHQIFAEELGWVPCNETKKEIDRYDCSCTQVGIFARGCLIACLRIHSPVDQFMIENEFKTIIGDHKVVKNLQCIEVTRFCIAIDVRKSQILTQHGTFPMVVALIKVLYDWCKSNDKDIFYMVVSNFFFRLLNLLGLPCTALAPAVTMPDGVVAVAAMSSWTAFEHYTAQKKPALLAWFRDRTLVDKEKMVG